MLIYDNEDEELNKNNQIRNNWFNSLNMIEEEKNKSSINDNYINTILSNLKDLNNNGIDLLNDNLSNNGSELSNNNIYSVYIQNFYLFKISNYA